MAALQDMTTCCFLAGAAGSMSPTDADAWQTTQVVYWVVV